MDFFEALRHGKLKRLLESDGPRPSLSGLPIDEQRRGFVFNGGDGLTYFVFRTDRVAGPVRVLSFQKTPKHMVLSEFLRFDAVLGWNCHISKYEQISKLMASKPHHIYSDKNTRTAQYKSDCGKLNAFSAEIHPAVYSHIFVPPSIDFELPVGEVAELAGYNVTIQILDKKRRVNGEEGWCFRATRQWGGEKCPSFVPDCVDLEAACDYSVQIDADLMRETMAHNESIVIPD